MSSSVSIVIPTWDGLELLKRFLDSVIAAATRYSERSNAPAELIIVDDGSLDHTAEWLIAQGFSECAPSEKASDAAAGVDIQAHYPLGLTLRYVRNETNRGFGEAC